MNDNLKFMDSDSLLRMYHRNEETIMEVCNRPISSDLKARIVDDCFSENILIENIVEERCELIPLIVIMAAISDENLVIEIE